MVFTLIYVIEMLSKIIVLGWKKYSSSLKNNFDGFITVLSMMTICYVYYTEDKFDNIQVIRQLVITRALRIFRLFMMIESFQMIGRTFVSVLPSAGRLILFLFCVMYIFSAIGVYFFGGLITRDPKNRLSYLLQETSFADNYYWANNFNDLISGINVSFNLLVINNWNEMESGIFAVTETKACRWYFFVFYVTCVVVVNNLVIALIIDTFINEFKNKDRDKFVFDVIGVTHSSSNLASSHDAVFCNKEQSVTESRKILSNSYINHKI